MAYRVVSLKGGCALLVASLSLLTACAGTPTPSPTLSPNEAATRLAQIPTAAIAPKATAAATDTPAPVVDVAPTALPVPEATSTAAPVLSPTPRTSETEYVVKDGDTLSSIADVFRISMASIQLANDMGESQIVQLGQKLKIPAGKQFADENVYWFVTIIRPGDTLTGLSARYGVSVNDLMRVNKLDNAANIRIGQALIVPITLPSNPAVSTGGPDEAAATEPLAEAAVEVNPAPAEVLVPTDDAANVRVAPTPEIIILEAPPQAIAPVEVAPDLSAAKAAPESVSASAPASVPASAIDPAVVANASSNGDIEAMRNTLLALYNQVRAEGGMPPLAASFILQQSAQGHADDCGHRGFGSHVGSDGAGARQRMLRVGYTGRVTGENWAWARSAEEAFTMWFYRETPDGPHRRNIMSGQYSEVGFGIVPSKGGYFFIANLGAP